MTPREKLQSVFDQYSELDHKRADIQQQLDEVRNGFVTARFNYLVETKVLQRLTWLIDGCHMSAKENKEIETEFHELFSENWYHWGFNLEPGVELRMDDGQISLAFNELPVLVDFCKRKNLPIDKRNIESQLEKLRKAHHRAKQEFEDASKLRDSLINDA